MTYFVDSFKDEKWNDEKWTKLNATSKEMQKICCREAFEK